MVRPYASGEHVALSVNPYHLGFSLWERIIEEQGLEAARRIMREDDDFSFVRNHLTRERAEQLGLFRFRASANGEVRVAESDLDALHEALLAPRYNFGAPSVAVSRIAFDGSLELAHDHRTDGRGLDPEIATRVLEYLHHMWRRPVRLKTVDSRGLEIELGVSAERRLN